MQEPATRQFYSASEPFSMSSSGVGSGENTTYDNPRDTKKDLPVTENNNKEINRRTWRSVLNPLHSTTG
ncbi:MAG: hypothetical protein WDO71_04955 [Bacteroidota bacterium]